MQSPQFRFLYYTKKAQNYIPKSLFLLDRDGYSLINKKLIAENTAKIMIVMFSITSLK